MKIKKTMSLEILRDHSNQWFPLTALGFILLYLFSFGISIFYLFYPRWKGRLLFR